MIGRASTGVRRRAALNMARLYSGELTDGDAKKVNGWRLSNQNTRKYQAEFLANAHLLADIDALMADDDLLRFADEPTAHALPLSSNWPVFATAAVLLAAVCIGWLYYPGSSQEWESTALRYVTRVGEQKTLNLDDGSVVTLNTGTQLIVNMTDSERRMILEQGEAFFDVAPDPQRPFTVDAGFRTVTVLGTQFNVRVYPEKLQLAVLDGMVALHPVEQQASLNAPLLEPKKLKNAKLKRKDLKDTDVRDKQNDDVILLRPGQVRVQKGWVVELDAANKQLLGYSASKLKNLSSWRSGQLEFAGMPLYRVIQDLNRYSHKKILIEDTSINELKIFAVVKISRLDLALDGLENTLPVKVTQYFDRIVLTGK